MSGGALPQTHRLRSSPVSAASVAAAGIRFEALQLDGEIAVWVEGRPGEGGRCVIVRRDVRGRTAASDVIAAPFSARSE